MGRLMRSFWTIPKWRWRDARALGLGFGIAPLDWHWTVRRYSSGMGWALAISAGPIHIELTINAGEDPR